MGFHTLDSDNVSKDTRRPPSQTLHSNTVWRLSLAASIGVTLPDTGRPYTQDVSHEAERNIV